MGKPRVTTIDASGFTLIELIITVAIILILSTVGLASYLSANRNSRDSKRKVDLEQIRSALEVYRNDCGTYPSPATGNKLGSPLVGTAALCLNNVYLQNVPVDPNPTGIYYYTNPTPTITYLLCSYTETSSTSPCTTPAPCNGSSCGSGTCNYQVCNP